MKKLLMALSCFVLASCANNINDKHDVEPVAAVAAIESFEIGSFEIDPVATAKNAMMCNVGGIITQRGTYLTGGSGDPIGISDVCLGVNKQGYFILEEVYSGRPEIDGKKRTDPYLSKPRTLSGNQAVFIRGTYIERFPDGSKRSECYFEEKGTPAQNPCVYWYANGQKSLQVGYVPVVDWVDTKIYPEPSTYKWGMDGRYESWYPSGEKNCAGEYKEGKIISTFTCWYQDGQKDSEGTYKKKIGLTQLVKWHQNGQKRAVENYDKGAKVGVWRFWNESGRLVKEEHYKEGDLHGASTEWYENGQKKAEKHYQHTKSLGARRSGIWREWGEDGHLKRKQDYGFMIWERE